MISRLHRSLSAVSPLCIFLLSYLVTSVLAVILYFTPIGIKWPTHFITDFSWDKFRQPFDIRYWTLILSPFVVTPVIALVTRSAVRPLVSRLSHLVAEFPPPLYAALTLSLYAYVTAKLIAADALGKLFRGTDAMEAVANRFALQAEAGFPPRVALLSCLIFLTVYSGVKASRRGGVFWTVGFAGNAAAMSVLLTLLNMKWPLVLFFCTLSLQVFVTARHHAIPKAIVTLALGGVCYLAISVVLLRLVAVPHISAGTALDRAGEINQPSPLAAKAPRVDGVPDYLGKVMDSSLRFAPVLFIAGINRMAMAIPYYWDVFGTDGPICGSLLDRVVLRKPGTCHPSNVVYERMFPDDGLDDPGTALAAAHIYEFAREGWPGAIAALILGGLLLGCFMALWPASEKSDTIAAVFVMGGPSGYLLSQVPIEGLVFYDHGIAWWSALILILSAVWWFGRSRQIATP